MAALIYLTAGITGAVIGAVVGWHVGQHAGYGLYARRVAPTLANMQDSNVSRRAQRFQQTFAP